MSTGNAELTKKIPRTRDKFVERAREYSFSNSTRFARFHDGKMAPYHRNVMNALYTSTEECKSKLNWRNIRYVCGMGFCDLTKSRITVALVTDEMVMQYKNKKITF